MLQIVRSFTEERQNKLKFMEESLLRLGQPLACALQIRLGGYVVCQFVANVDHNLWCMLGKNI
jgi:hypothetical protein